MTFPKKTALCVLSIVTLGWATSVPAQDGKEGAKRERGDRDSSRPGPEMFESLSPEERDRIRAAFGEVWNDPAVVQARDEVGRATKAYKEAMHEAIQSIDPEAAELIQRVRKEHGERGRPDFQEPGEMPRGPKGPGGKGKGKAGSESQERAVSGIVRMVENPPFLKELSEEDRVIYQAARETAAQSEAVRELQAQIMENRKAEETRREKRIELFESYLKTYFEEMSAADPRVEAMLKDRRPTMGGRSE